MNDILEQNQEEINIENKNIIEVKTYLKKFRKNKIGELSFNIDNGSITAVLGSSGSGKSVIINSIVGALKRYSGEILVNDKKIKKFNGFKVNKDIGFYTQIDFSLINVSLYSYLKTMCIIMGIKKKFVKESIQYWVSFFGLEDSINKKLKNFSWGMKNRVNLILAFIKEPQIIILDEPGANLDSYWRNKLKKLLIKYKEEGKTIIVTSHNIDELSDIIEYYIVIDNGELLFEGSAMKLNIYTKYKILLTDNFDRDAFINFLTKLDIEFYKFDDEEKSMTISIRKYKQINYVFLYLVKQNLPIKNLKKIPINMEAIHKAIEDYKKHN